MNGFFFEIFEKNFYIVESGTVWANFFFIYFKLQFIFMLDKLCINLNITL